MELTRQISIFAANEPGALTRICNSLTESSINIIGMTVVDHTDHALVRVIPSDARKAIHLLEEAGLPVMDGDILKVSLDRGPGHLEQIAGKLGEAGLNIDYLYATEPSNGGATTMYIMTSDNEKALAVLKMS